MSGARSNRISTYDAPNSKPDGFKRRVLCIPDNPRIVAAVNDMLAYLTRPFVWNESDQVSEVEMRSMLTTMWLGYLGELERMIGAIIPMVADILPENMLWCDGAQYPRSAFPDLYGRLPAALIVDADTFQVPDLSGRFLLGADTGQNIGDTGGESEHTLTETEMPTHYHTYSPLVSESVELEAPGAPNLFAAGIIPLVQGVTDSAGGGAPHNNLPPYFVVKYAIVATWRGC